jgi:hypothetical protein
MFRGARPWPRLSERRAYPRRAGDRRGLAVGDLLVGLPVAVVVDAVAGLDGEGPDVEVLVVAVLDEVLGRRADGESVVVTVLTIFGEAEASPAGRVGLLLLSRGGPSPLPGLASRVCERFPGGRSVCCRERCWQGRQGPCRFCKSIPRSFTRCLSLPDLRYSARSGAEPGSTRSCGGRAAWDRRRPTIRPGSGRRFVQFGRKLSEPWPARSNGRSLLEGR